MLKKIHKTIIYFGNAPGQVIREGWETSAGYPDKGMMSVEPEPWELYPTLS
jgi:hypothetical protein